MKYPLVTQDGLKDCGVSCLLMIMKYYGGDISKEYLRELTNTTKSGVDAYSLVEAAKKVGFEAEGVKGNINDLVLDDLPCIAHVVIEEKYQHFVVVYKIDRKKKQVLIGDPASSIKKISLTEFETISTGVFLLLNPIKKLPVLKSDNQLLNILFKFLFSNKKILVIIVLLSLFSTVISIVLSFQFQLLLEWVIEYQSTTNLSKYILVFSLFILIKGIMQMLKEKMFIYLNCGLSKHLIMDMYNRILSLPYLYYKNRSTGEIIARIHDLENVQEFISKIIICFSIDLFLILFVYLTLLKINLSMTIVLSVMLVLLLFISLVFWHFIYPCLLKLKEKWSLFNSYLVESISGIETIGNFNLQKYSLVNIFKRYEGYNSINIVTMKAASYFSWMRDLIEQYGTFVLLIVGGRLVMNGEMGLGLFISYYTLVGYLLEPVQNLLSLGLNYKDVRASYQKTQDFYQIPSDTNNGELNNTITGKLELEKISYHYHPKKRVLTNINLNISPGDRVLIYGKSGSGKSTLAKIMARIIDSQDGKITLDNYNINDYEKEYFYSQVCYLSQNEVLFTNSVYENISLNKDNTYQTFLDVCKLCKVDEIVDGHMLSYKMLLEENGFNLSGGERQRIILARAIYRNANLYIFDESLNEIDVEREREILNDLFNKYPDKTFIVISHRYHNNDLYSKKLEIRDGKCYEVS